MLCCLSGLTLSICRLLWPAVMLARRAEGPCHCRRVQFGLRADKLTVFLLMRFTVRGHSPSEHTDISNRPFCICPLSLLSPSGHTPLLLSFWPNKSLRGLPLSAAGFWPVVISSPDNYCSCEDKGDSMGLQVTREMVVVMFVEYYGSCRAQLQVYRS